MARDRNIACCSERRRSANLSSSTQERDRTRGCDNLCIFTCKQKIPVRGGKRNVSRHGIDRACERDAQLRIHFDVLTRDQVVDACNTVACLHVDAAGRGTHQHVGPRKVHAIGDTFKRDIPSSRTHR